MDERFGVEEFEDWRRVERGQGGCNVAFYSDLL